MAVMKWDQIGEHYYEIGVDHVALYVMKADGTYEKGVPWNGITNVTESPEGADPNDFYADNIKYGSLRAAETFAGSIEAYTYPPEFAPCDGMVVASNGVYVGQQNRTPFGFAYRTMVGNDTHGVTETAYKLHLVYNCTVSPSEKAYDTINDSPEPGTLSWDVNSTPVAVTGMKATSSITIDSTKADPDKLKALEAKLFGSETEEPTLPTPDEVLTMMAAA